MKKITLLKSLLVVMALSLFSFSVVAEEVTLSFDSKASNRAEYSTSKQVWVDNTASPKIVFTNLKAQSQNDVADYENPVRCYAGSSITIETIIGYKITKIVATCGSDKYATDLKESIGGEASVSSSVVTIIPTQQGLSYFVESLNAQVRIKTLNVTIEVDGGAAETPSISAMNVAFGILSETNATKTITVTGANLTNAITTTLKTGTAFELSGDLTKDGGDLTVKFIATEAATYSDEITLTSGETTKTIEVSATLVETEGNGTKENPYTCDDVKLLNNSLTSGKYWVKGYILGCIKNNAIETPSFTQVSNLALGAIANAEDYVPIQLPSGDVRTALNIVDNPTLLGREVLVYGNLENYFSKPGVKNVTDYVIVEENGGTATSVDVTTISNIYTLNRTIVAEGEFEIYTVTGQNVTGMNGSLENGVYVVRTANAAVKVVVK